MAWLVVLLVKKIVLVLDFKNKLFSSKFQIPSPGALVGDRGT
jgi:hypothetical protein